MLRLCILVLFVLAALAMAMPSSNLRGYGANGPAWLHRLSRPDELVALQDGLLGVMDE